MPRQTILSADRAYRYTLWREWDLFDTRTVMVIGLNPSSADERVDDPTIRRCIGFAKRWGYGCLCMTNLFAYRSTDPRELTRQAEPVGPDNDGWLVRCAAEADLIVAAWGEKGSYRGRGKAVMGLLGRPMICLKITKMLAPMHPLYAPYDAVPVPWGGL